MMLLLVQPEAASGASSEMRTTVTLNDELLARAAKLMGSTNRSSLLEEGLKALIQRESARRLAKLGGTQSRLKEIPRRRAAVVE